ncbi:hypothetical protein IEQ34_002027 [Dendrobium chrysotoxum]|uniref:Uncharacterized protein n=1 Tax=Dendrobium chrysotoxum TaxID=161865 RepID=A0AAV7H3U1_DENCH|nr:hypothetical protein IEQ34_002027 [Dendrobium chrysotoxum]
MAGLSEAVVVVVAELGVCGIAARAVELWRGRVLKGGRAAGDGGGCGGVDVRVNGSHHEGKRRNRMKSKRKI